MDIKILVSLSVLLSCGLRPARGATNDAPCTPDGTMPSRSKSACESRPGGVTTNIPENKLFEHDVERTDPNSLNASSNWKLSAPGQQAASTNSVPSEEWTMLWQVDAAAVTRVNQRRNWFSDQDKYGGIFYTACRADNPLQLINPFAPQEYSQSEAAQLPRERITGVPSGWSVFAIRFK